MNRKLAVIGVGNMAKAIISGVVAKNLSISEILLYDKNSDQYENLPREGSIVFRPAETIAQAVLEADCVLLSVKPQNFPELLSELATCNNFHSKLYVTIAAGITSQSISTALCGARVVRVLPNIPMVIGRGVSVICRNTEIDEADFSFVRSLFDSSGSTVLIDECDMNKIIGVTSSSPAYVFKFIDCIYQGALAQGLDGDGLIDAICDVFIGSAMLLKSSKETPDALISKVASKGGTTEKALEKLSGADVDKIITDAMIACTARADELGRVK